MQPDVTDDVLIFGMIASDEIQLNMLGVISRIQSRKKVLGQVVAIKSND